MSDALSVIVDFKQKISFIRFVGNAMIASNFVLKAEVLPGDEVDEVDFEIVFSKIRFWFDNIVSNSIVFCSDNENVKNMMLIDGQPKILNHIMITPNEPTDEHLAVLFQSKMEAFSNGNFIFGEIRMTPENAGLIFTYVGTWEDDLPSMEEWFPEKPYYFETPWWTRDDISTLDLKASDFDINKNPIWAAKMDFIENNIRPNDDSSEGKAPIEEHKNIIIKGSFKPKVVNIETDKNDD